MKKSEVIKEKVNKGEALSLSEIDVLLNIIRKYEFGIQKTTERLKEVENEYNPSLHGGAYKSYLNNLAINIRDILESFK